MARQDTLPVISQIKINGQLYNIRDKQSPEGALHFLGINEGTGPEHKISDGGTQTPIIDATEVTTLQKGDVVLQLKSGSTGDYQEFVWVGTRWELLGDEGSYVTKGTYTTNLSYTGITVGAPTFTGTTETISLSGSVAGQNAPVEESPDTSIPEITLTGSLGGINTVTHTHTFSVANATVTSTASYQPKGTVSAPTFTGTSDSHTHAINIDNATAASGNYQPKGTITAPTIASKTISVTVPIPSELTITTNTTGNYQPKGTISKPGVSWNSKDAKTVVTGISEITPSTTTVYTASPTVTNEVLEFIASTVMTGITGGTVTSTASVIGASSTMQLAATPTFTGTTVAIGLSTITTNVAATADFDFTLNAPTFTGDWVLFENDGATITPSGTISQPTFTGTTETITSTGTYSKLNTINSAGVPIPTTVSITKRLIAKVASTSFSASGNYQPKGTNSAPIVYDDGHTHTTALS